MTCLLVEVDYHRRAGVHRRRLVVVVDLLLEVALLLRVRVLVVVVAPDTAKLRQPPLQRLKRAVSEKG
jgi:hypothetical protein